MVSSIFLVGHVRDPSSLSFIFFVIVATLAATPVHGNIEGWCYPKSSQQPPPSNYRLPPPNYFYGLQFGKGKNVSDCTLTFDGGKDARYLYIDADPAQGTTELRNVDIVVRNTRFLPGTWGAALWIKRRLVNCRIILEDNVEMQWNEGKPSYQMGIYMAAEVVDSEIMVNGTLLNGSWAVPTHMIRAASKFSGSANNISVTNSRFLTSLADTQSSIYFSKAAQIHSLRMSDNVFDLRLELPDALAVGLHIFEDLIIHTLSFERNRIQFHQTPSSLTHSQGLLVRLAKAVTFTGGDGAGAGVPGLFVRDNEVEGGDQRRLLFVAGQANAAVWGGGGSDAVLDLSRNSLKAAPRACLSCSSVIVLMLQLESSIFRNFSKVFIEYNVIEMNYELPSTLDYDVGNSSSSSSDICSSNFATSKAALVAVSVQIAALGVLQNTIISLAGNNINASIIDGSFAVTKHACLKSFATALRLKFSAAAKMNVTSANNSVYLFVVNVTDVEESTCSIWAPQTAPGTAVDPTLLQLPPRFSFFNDTVHLTRVLPVLFESSVHKKVTVSNFRTSLQFLQPLLGNITFRRCSVHVLSDVVPQDFYVAPLVVPIMLSRAFTAGEVLAVDCTSSFLQRGALVWEGKGSHYLVGTLLIARAASLQSIRAVRCHVSAFFTSVVEPTVFKEKLLDDVIDIRVSVIYLKPDNRGLEGNPPVSITISDCHASLRGSTSSSVDSGGSVDGSITTVQSATVSLLYTQGVTLQWNLASRHIQIRPSDAGSNSTVALANFRAVEDLTATAVVDVTSSFSWGMSTSYFPNQRLVVEGVAVTCEQNCVARQLWVTLCKHALIANFTASFVDSSVEANTAASGGAVYAAFDENAAAVGATTSVGHVLLVNCRVAVRGWSNVSVLKTSNTALLAYQHISIFNSAPKTYVADGRNITITGCSLYGTQNHAMPPSSGGAQQPQYVVAVIFTALKTQFGPAGLAVWVTGNIVDMQLVVVSSSSSGTTTDDASFPYFHSLYVVYVSCAGGVPLAVVVAENTLRARGHGCGRNGCGVALMGGGLMYPNVENLPWQLSSPPERTATIKMNTVDITLHPPYAASTLRLASLFVESPFSNISFSSNNCSVTAVPSNVNWGVRASPLDSTHIHGIAKVFFRRLFPSYRHGSETDHLLHLQDNITVLDNFFKFEQSQDDSAGAESLVGGKFVVIGVFLVQSLPFPHHVGERLSKIAHRAAIHAARNTAVISPFSSPYFTNCISQQATVFRATMLLIPGDNTLQQMETIITDNRFELGGSSMFLSPLASVAAILAAPVVCGRYHFNTNVFRIAVPPPAAAAQKSKVAVVIRGRVQLGLPDGDFHCQRNSLFNITDSSVDIIATAETGSGGGSCLDGRSSSSSRPGNMSLVSVEVHRPGAFPAGQLIIDGCRVSSSGTMSRVAPVIADFWPALRASGESSLPVNATGATTRIVLRNSQLPPPLLAAAGIVAARWSDQDATPALSLGAALSTLSGTLQAQQKLRLQLGCGNNWSSWSDYHFSRAVAASRNGSKNIIADLACGQSRSATVMQTESSLSGSRTAGSKTHSAALTDTKTMTRTNSPSPPPSLSSSKKTATLTQSSINSNSSLTISRTASASEVEEQDDASTRTPSTTQEATPSNSSEQDPEDKEKEKSSVLPKELSAAAAALSIFASPTVAASMRSLAFAVGLMGCSSGNNNNSSTGDAPPSELEWDSNMAHLSAGSKGLETYGGAVLSSIVFCCGFLFLNFVAAVFRRHYQKLDSLRQGMEKTKFPSFTFVAAAVTCPPALYAAIVLLGHPFAKSSSDSSNSWLGVVGIVAGVWPLVVLLYLAWRFRNDGELLLPAEDESTQIAMKNAPAKDCADTIVRLNDFLSEPRRAYERPSSNAMLFALFAENHTSVLAAAFDYFCSAVAVSIVAGINTTCTTHICCQATQGTVAAVCALHLVWILLLKPHLVGSDALMIPLVSLLTMVVSVLALVESAGAASEATMETAAMIVYAVAMLALAISTFCNMLPVVIWICSKCSKLFREVQRRLDVQWEENTAKMLQNPRRKKKDEQSGAAGKYSGEEEEQEARLLDRGNGRNIDDEDHDEEQEAKRMWRRPPSTTNNEEKKGTTKKFSVELSSLSARDDAEEGGEGKKLPTDEEAMEMLQQQQQRRHSPSERRASGAAAAAAQTPTTPRRSSSFSGAARRASPHTGRRAPSVLDSLKPVRFADI